MTEGGHGPQTFVQAVALCRNSRRLDVASFDGSDSHVRLPTADAPGGGPASVSMWFRMPLGSTAGVRPNSHPPPGTLPLMNQLPVRSNGAFGRGFCRFSGASALNGSAGPAVAAGC